MSSNDGIGDILPRQHPGGRGTVGLLLRQTPMNALDDIIALTDLPQRGFRALVHSPAIWSDLMR
ncbi:hypothetical protein A0U92_02775 [Acetobacter aceti]|uniref:Uncharacterized protein n=1 Tax=Acetobacter aceti TaxID=435 RepID=A0A1U9KDJ1_ACEAC|nr:hypothetical protein A0U92_02775 [Acetobacter aceti]